MATSPVCLKAGEIRMGDRVLTYAGQRDAWQELAKKMQDICPFDINENGRLVLEEDPTNGKPADIKDLWIFGRIVTFGPRMSEYTCCLICDSVTLHTSSKERCQVCGARDVSRETLVRWHAAKKILRDGNKEVP